MWEAILSLIISFVFTYATIPVVIRVAEQKGLFSIRNERKRHMASKPSLGGLCIFAGFMFTSLLTIKLYSFFEFQYFLAAVFVIFFLGLKDDILVIAPLKKFLGQVLATIFIVHFGGLQVQNLHGLLGIHELPFIASILITYLTIIVVINSYNLIDGVDGLAGSLSLMTTTILGIYFSLIGLIPYAALSFSLAGSLAAFLIFNFQPAKIFMGDTGYLLIGLVCSILVVKFMNVSTGDPDVPVSAPSAIAFSLLAIPLLNTIRLFGKRIIYRHLPLVHSKNHIHHFLLALGFSHRKVTLCLVVMNALFIVLTSMEQSVGSNWLIMAIIGSFFLSIVWLKRVAKKRAGTFENASIGNNDTTAEVKLFSVQKTVMEESD